MPHFHDFFSPSVSSSSSSDSESSPASKEVAPVASISGRRGLNLTMEIPTSSYSISPAEMVRNQQPRHNQLPRRKKRIVAAAAQNPEVPPPTTPSPTEQLGPLNMGAPVLPKVLTKNFGWPGSWQTNAATVGRYEIDTLQPMRDIHEIAPGLFLCIARDCPEGPHPEPTQAGFTHVVHVSPAPCPGAFMQMVNQRGVHQLHLATSEEDRDDGCTDLTEAQLHAARTFLVRCQEEHEILRSVFRLTNRPAADMRALIAVPSAWTTDALAIAGLYMAHVQHLSINQLMIPINENEDLPDAWHGRLSPEGATYIQKCTGQSAESTWEDVQAAAIEPNLDNVSDDTEDMEAVGLAL